jgi:hypothetical protein
MTTPSSAPVIPDHFDLNFLLNPENQPLFIHTFSGPEHEYLEEQYHTLCKLQDTMLKLDNLLKFTVNNPKNCPFHHVDSPPYHSEDDDEEEEEEEDIPDQLCDDEFDDDLGSMGKCPGRTRR